MISFCLRMINPFRCYVEDKLLKSKKYIFKSRKIKSIFYLPYVKTDLIQNIIYRSGRYFESDNLDYVCKQWHEGVVEKRIAKSSVLDIGANIGNHTLYFVNECNARHVFCFEPIKDTFEILKTNMKINQICDRVTLYKFAVGECSGKAQVEYYDTANIGGTSIELSDSGDIIVKSVDEMNLDESVGLVKIDVEGFEMSVLRGIVNTLKKDMPYIMIEINNDNYVMACSLLEGIGYKHTVLNQLDTYRDCLFYAN